MGQLNVYKWMRYASEIKENKGESEPKKHLYLMV
jgi:hypothetical protein